MPVMVPRPVAASWGICGEDALKKKAPDGPGLPALFGQRIDEVVAQLILVERAGQGDVEAPVIDDEPIIPQDSIPVAVIPHPKFKPVHLAAQCCRAERAQWSHIDLQL